MHKFLQQLWSLQPGIFVTLLGVEALVITLLPSALLEHTSIKAIAVLFCFAFAVSEIWIVKRDRMESNELHKHDMEAISNRFGRLHLDLVALQSNASATLQSSSLPPSDLKRRALELSNEILQFLLSREIPPGFGQGGFGETSFGGKPSATEEYDKQTLDCYFIMFKSKVEKIREDFTKRNIVDQQFDAEHLEPVNTYSVRVIAERIGLMARRLGE